MGNPVLLEICCGSVDDVVEAYKGGANRVELNSDLFHGGLTPSVGSLLQAKKRTNLPIMCMVRPREGGFCYTECEYAAMLDDARILLDHGADGIVFGFLKEDGTIDVERCRTMLHIIGDKQSVFHRAIDVVPDVFEALETLISLGVTRVLTSGQHPSVPEGVDMIRKMIEYANGRIEILPGGGVNKSNIVWCLKATGAKMIHATAHKIMFDRSTMGNPTIYYGGAVYPPEDKYQMVNRDLVAELSKSLNY